MPVLGPDQTFIWLKIFQPSEFVSDSNGGVLCDEVGFGKTACAIALISMSKFDVKDELFCIHCQVDEIRSKKNGF